MNGSQSDQRLSNPSVSDHMPQRTIPSFMSRKTIKASEFKTKCLQLMEEIKQTGGEIIITKNGVPMCKLIPVRHKPKTLFGAHNGKIDIKGDILAPIVAG